jgi:hypothetical protein
MRGAAVCLSTALAAAPSAIGQTLPPDAPAAHSVGAAAAMLLQASPCFPGLDRERELEAMMAAARARIDARPDHAAAFHQGMGIASVQQRYIARSGTVACEQIRMALMHYLPMQN